MGFDHTSTRPYFNVYDKNNNTSGNIQKTNTFFTDEWINCTGTSTPVSEAERHRELENHSPTQQQSDHTCTHTIDCESIGSCCSSWMRDVSENTRTFSWRWTTTFLHATSAFSFTVTHAQSCVCVFHRDWLKALL